MVLKIILISCYFTFFSCSLCFGGYKIESITKQKGQKSFKQITYVDGFKQKVITYYPKNKSVMYMDERNLTSCNSERKVCMFTPLTGSGSLVSSIFSNGLVSFKYHKYKLRDLKKSGVVAGKKCKKSVVDYDMTVKFPIFSYRMVGKVNMCSIPLGKKFVKKCIANSKKMFKTTKKSGLVMSKRDTIATCKLGHPIKIVTKYKNKDGKTKTTTTIAKKIKRIKISAKKMSIPKNYQLMPMPNIGGILDSMIGGSKSQEVEEEPKEQGFDKIKGKIKGLFDF